jgi:hypothetical protein
MKKGDTQLTERNAVLEELRAMGVRVTLHAGSGDVPIYIRMHGTVEWGPEFSRKVAEVLTRHGMGEVREGLWSSGDEAHTRQLEELIRADDEYKCAVEAVTEHPDWTDQEIADAYHVPVEEVENIRNQE